MNSPSSAPMSSDGRVNVSPAGRTFSGLPVLEIVSAALEHICALNDERFDRVGYGLTAEEINRHRATYEATRLFQSEHMPAISIREYLKRLMRYSGCAPESCLSALLYIDGIFGLLPGFELHSLNVHRLYLTSLMLATKFYEDHYFNNALWAKIGGIPVQELNHQEIRFLELIGWDLTVPVDAFRPYFAQLLNFAARKMLISSVLPYLSRFDNVVAEQATKSVTKLDIQEDGSTNRESNMELVAVPDPPALIPAVTFTVLPYSTPVGVIVTAPVLAAASVPMVETKTIDSTPRVGDTDSDTLTDVSSTVDEIYSQLSGEVYWEMAADLPSYAQVAALGRIAFRAMSPTGGGQEVHTSDSKLEPVSSSSLSSGALDSQSQSSLVTAMAVSPAPTNANSSVPESFLNLMPPMSGSS